MPGPAERWTLAAQPPASGQARGLARRFAVAHGGQAEVVAAVELAVSEAVANAVVHAYPDGAGEIAIELSAEPARLLVAVSDHGTGFRARDDSPGAGFGLLLIERLCVDVSISETHGGGMTVLMSFARL